MPGEKDLSTLLKTLEPTLQEGEYVFCCVPELDGIDQGEVLLSFREAEGVTVILRKERADGLGLTYSYVAAWITLTAHSSLEAVGLTAAFSGALAGEGISCNVVAAYYHDHIFVNAADAARAMAVLQTLSQ